MPSIGIDLGGTNIKGGLVNENGGVVLKIKRETRSYQAVDKVLDRTFKVIDELLKSAKRVSGIGIGVAGQIDSEGVVTDAPNLNWHNVPLKKPLEERYKIPIFLENDVNCAALAESRFGAGRGAKGLVCVFIGTGIGGGIVIDGKLLKGATNSAAEIGHMKIHPFGPRCGCGGYGCWEALASGQNIVKYALEKLKDEPNSLIYKIVNNDLDKVNVNIVYKSAQMGDKLSQDVLELATKYWGIGIANLVNILNPEMVILGGGVINSTPSLLELIRNKLKTLVLPVALKKLKLAIGKLGQDAGLIGASLLKD
ncbi:MAG: ROK family protein [bacterium]|nr:ROK family protein [bacterium]